MKTTHNVVLQQHQTTRLDDLIPDYYDEVVEPHTLAAAEQPLIDKLEAAISTATASQSVITADSAALSVYESMLGIVPKKDEDLDTRRYNVLMEVLPPQPLTEPYLREVLKLLNINATLVVVGREFRVDVIASPTDKGSTERLATLLNKYLPANLTFTHRIQTPTHLYYGVVARVNRKIQTACDLFTDRTVTAPLDIFGGNVTRYNRELQTKSDLLEDRSVTVNSETYIGSHGRIDRSFHAKTENKDTTVGFARVGSAIVKE